MKKILAALLALVSSVVFGATLNPIQLLNPTGSSAGQAIVSTGASSAPAWATVPLSGLSSIAANTVLANATASSAAPAAFAMPSCSTSSSALNWTTSTGFTCNTSINAASLGGNAANTYAPLASPTFTGTVTIPSGASISGYLTTASAASTYAPLASPTLTGTTTITNISVSGTTTGIAGRLLNVQVFTASGTYTPTTGAKSAIVRVVGGGGGGGGSAACTASQNAIGGGGTSGSYAEIYIASGLSSQTVTIGALGAGGVAGANVGSNGGASSFGALVSAPGGIGGVAGTASTPPVNALTNGSLPAAPSGSGTFLVKASGSSPVFGVATALGTFYAGAGASSPLGGGGGTQVGTAAGNAATGNGAGGGGASTAASGAAQAGGNGSVGAVIVYEFD